MMQILIGLHHRSWDIHVHVVKLLVILIDLIVMLRGGREEGGNAGRPFSPDPRSPSIARPESNVVDACVQTDLTGVDIDSLQHEFNHLSDENIRLKEMEASYQIKVDTFKGNNDKVKFFTGLPPVLMALFNYIAPFLNKGPSGSLDEFQQLILVLVLLRLNLSIQFLAYYFRVSAASVTIFFKCVKCHAC